MSAWPVKTTLANLNSLIIIKTTHILFNYPKSQSLSCFRCFKN